MASTITALTGGGGVAVAGDTSGVLELKTNNGTTAVTISTSQVVTLANALPVASGGTGLTAAGTSGNALVSDGTNWTSGKQTITSGTAVSASGTSIDFTSIPSWVKRITVMFSGVSTSGTSPILVQIGSGSVDATSYASVGTGTDATSSGLNTATTGYVMRLNSSSNSVSAQMVLTTLGSNVWVASHSGSQGSASLSGGGTKTTSGTLDRVRITTVNGTDAFDAGTINILYE